MNITGKNLIGYDWSSKNPSVFQAYNPYSGTLLPEKFHTALTQETETALLLAARCFPIFSQLSAERRADFLSAICQEILNLGDTLLERANLETGLPLPRLKNERARTIKQISQFADLLKDGTWVNATLDTTTPVTLRKMNVPLGPVAVFGSSNFPFAYSVAGVDTGPALAAGCPVIVKAHPAHPGVSELTAQAILKAAIQTNMPEGVISLLFDDGYTVAEQIVKHPSIKAVAFTGSIKGGMALHHLVNERKDPIPVYAEMGSVNPIVILPATLKHNSEKIAKQLVSSITTNGGQFCTKPGLLFLLNTPELEKFKEDLKHELTQIEPATLLTQGIAKNFEKSYSNVVQTHEVNQSARSGQVTDGQNSVVPVLASTDAETFISNPNLKEEIFGPYSLLVIAENHQQMKDALSTLDGQLTASIYWEEKEWNEGMEVLKLLQEKSGRVIINGVPTGVEVSTAMHHGGPFPATIFPYFSSVGKDSILRFVRPQTFQNWPDELLPPALQNSNPTGIMRRVDDNWTSDPLQT